MEHLTEGTSFLFVGKLSSMTREQARALVEACGAVCPSAVSWDLDYLVVGDEQSPFYGGDKKPKQIKAEALIEAGARIAVITEGEFLAMLGVEDKPAERIEGFGLPAQAPACRPGQSTPPQGIDNMS